MKRCRGAPQTVLTDRKMTIASLPPAGTERHQLRHWRCGDARLRARIRVGIREAQRAAFLDRGKDPRERGVGSHVRVRHFDNITRVSQPTWLTMVMAEGKIQVGKKNSVLVFTFLYVFIGSINHTA